MFIYQMIALLLEMFLEWKAMATIDMQLKLVACESMLWFVMMSVVQDVSQQLTFLTLILSGIAFLCCHIVCF